MGLDALLGRLQRVRKTGPGRWRACCPTHGSGRNQALAIRELADGRILVHDFGGCSLEQVLSAVGVEIADLAPHRLLEHLRDGERRYSSRERTPWVASDVLAALAEEAQFVALAASDLAQGQQLSEERRGRLWSAAGRLAAAVGWVNGR
jgi:hypothetical protein